VLGEIQELSIFGVLEKYRALISERVLDEVYAMRESIRFAGCSICLRLHREGVLEEINQRAGNASVRQLESGEDYHHRVRDH